ncbi:MAG TPA: hypothetical protein VHA75_13965, partial [Rugosimonospora sp.]|nr:hypothetical protein [Rugosimonospora sp.]
MRRGHGVGQALVKVDRHVVEEMLDEVIPPLQRHGFLPPDLDRPFRSRAATGKLRKAGARSSKLDNLELLYKMISGEALDTHYNDIHVAGNGMSFTLRRRSGGTVTSARVTVTAEQVLSGRTDRATGNSVHFRRRTGEYHVVNLAMGLDIAGQSAGGSQKFTLGAKAGLGFTALPHLRTFSMGVEYDRSIGASESATTITNTPQLMEYPGDVDEFRLPSRYRVTIDFEDDAIPQVVTPLMPATATVHLLPHFNVDPPAPQAAPQSAPQAPQSAPKASPKASPKATTSGGSALPPPPSLFDASLFEAGFASLDAQLASLNGPPTARYPITGPARTPHEVLDQAVVYYLDTSGVLAAARRQEPRLTRPGKAADQEVVNFTSNISMTAHLKEIVHGEYTTDTLFEPGILRDEHAALSISGRLGGSEFAGATPDQYTLGLIKLVLTQAGQTASRSHGITWNQLDVAGGSDVTSPHLASAAGEATSAHRWGRSETRGLRQTGGKEFLELNFQRAYAFRTVVDFDVRGAHEKRSKLLPHLKMVRAGETVANREMIYLLSEPDALEQFAEGRVPIPDTQLADVFARWSAGTTSLSASILARVLARWETLHRTSAAGAPDPHALARVAWAARLARQHASDAVPIRDPAARQAFQNTFRALSLQAKPSAPVTPFSAGTSAKGAVPPKGPQPPTGSPATFVPPYLTKRGPRAVGHAGFHKLSYSGTRKTTFDLVYEAVQEAAP